MNDRRIFLGGLVALPFISNFSLSEKSNNTKQKIIQEIKKSIESDISPSTKRAECVCLTTYQLRNNTPSPYSQERIRSLEINIYSDNYRMLRTHWIFINSETNGIEHVQNLTANTSPFFEKSGKEKYSTFNHDKFYRYYREINKGNSGSCGIKLTTHYKNESLTSKDLFDIGEYFRNYGSKENQ